MNQQNNLNIYHIFLFFLNNDLNKEVISTAQVMEEIKSVSTTYEPLSISMTLVYFSLEKLSDINFLYQFGLQFFLRVIDKILNNNQNNNNNNNDVKEGEINDVKERVLILTKLFFTEISKRVLRSLKFEDKVLFVSRLSQIFLIFCFDVLKTIVCN